MAIDTWIFLQGGDSLIQRFDYDGSNHVIYHGWAQAGTATSAASWRIQQLNYTGDNVVSLLWPSGSPTFNYIWDNRASLSYS